MGLARFHLNYSFHAECPFFKGVHSDTNCIACESISDLSTYDLIHFTKNCTMSRYMDMNCRKKYRECPRYKALMEIKYEWKD